MTTPSDPQAAARDVIESVLSRQGTLESPFVGQRLTPEEARFLAGGVTDAILAALAAAGLVITAPDAPYRGTASLRQLGRLKPLIVPDDFDAPDAPSGTVKEPNELEHEADSGMMFNVTTYVYPDQIARWMVTTSGLTRDEMITWVTSVYAAGSDPA
jgi:hypothetical protein